MAHGYHNFMNNKDFHPSNYTNQRRIWEAEQKKAQEEKRQEELRQQYLKEQEVYRSKELLGKANPLNFMYEPPPGFAKDEKEGKGGEEGKLELKFDWQKPGKMAPREEYAKDMQLRDKPFGVEVRNVKCIKCGKWGHINTDRECPLFGKARPTEEGAPVKPVLLDVDSREDGLIFKQCVKDRVVDNNAGNQQILASDEETEIHDLLAGMGEKERRRILKKMRRIQSQGGDRAQGDRGKKRKHKKRRLKDRKEKRKKDRDRSESESEEEGARKRRKRRKRHTEESSGEGSSEEEERRKRRKGRKGHSDTTEDSSSEGDSEEEERRRKRRRRRKKRSKTGRKSD